MVPPVLSHHVGACTSAIFSASDGKAGGGPDVAMKARLAIGGEHAGVVRGKRAGQAIGTEQVTRGAGSHSASHAPTLASILVSLSLLLCTPYHSICQADTG